MDVLDRVKQELGQLAEGVGTAKNLNHQAPATGAAWKMKHTVRFAEAVVLVCQGLAASQVAALMGLDTATFKRNYLGNPTFRELLKEANAEAYTRVVEDIKANASSMQARAAALAEDALDKMEELLTNSPNEHIQFKVAQDLLDRDPRISRTKRLEASGAGMSVTLPPGTVLLAMQAAGEVEKSKMRDVTPTTEPPKEPTGV